MEQDSLQEIRRSLTDSLERLFLKMESLEQRLGELERASDVKATDNAPEKEDGGPEEGIASAVVSGWQNGSEENQTVAGDLNGADGSDCDENAAAGEEPEDEVWNLETEPSVQPRPEEEKMEDAEENELEQTVELAVEEAEAAEAAGEAGESEKTAVTEQPAGLENEAHEIVNETARADWYDWEVDYPASHIDNIYDGIGINDRYEFIRELFNVNGNLHEAELLFKRTIDDLNRLDSFKEVLVYVRARFPQWDEFSDEVYRFYMIVRRKFS